MKCLTHRDTDTLMHYLEETWGEYEVCQVLKMLKDMEERIKRKMEHQNLRNVSCIPIERYDTKDLLLFLKDKYGKYGDFQVMAILTGAYEEIKKRHAEIIQENN